MAADTGTPDIGKRFGKINFDAYRNIRKGVAHDGSPIPQWEDLGDDVRLAWEVAAAMVVVELMIYQAKKRMAGEES